MKRTLLFALAAASVFLASSVRDVVSSAVGEPIRLMRRPDISRGRIVFTWAGDLWLVPEQGGDARRLTVHEGVEDYPKFSPDGSMIAFSGDYNGRPNSVCVLPADGSGGPTQLTWHAAGGLPVCWTRDGEEIVYASTQESFVRFFKKFFRVRSSGGLPVELPLGKGSFASYSPDGSKLAFNRSSDSFWWWKRYKGSANQDVWIYDFKADTFTKITDWQGNDTWPMWTGERIYFASDRVGGVNNVFYYDLATKETKQVTRFEDRGVTWPSMSADGAKIVFEREARLYVLETASGESREVVVRAPLDTRADMISYVSPLEHLSGFDVSPSAKRIVYEARGDLYTMPAQHGDVRNLTQSSGARDGDPAWSPDGKWIAYVSDKSGDDEIYLVDQMGVEPEKKLTSSGHFKSDLGWSPESDKMLFTTEENALYILGMDGGEPKLIAKNEHREITNYSWSPDGKYIAYDFSARNRNRDIFIHDVKTGESRQVTRDLGDDWGAAAVRNNLGLVAMRRGDYDLARERLRASLADFAALGARWAVGVTRANLGDIALDTGESLPCDLLVVDELGPLEFERGRGWTAGLAAVDSGAYGAALVVVRSGLLERARTRWPGAEVADAASPHDRRRLAERIGGGGAAGGGPR